MAQLVAHLHGMQGVRGSSPLSSTIESKEPPRWGGSFVFSGVLGVDRFGCVCRSCPGSLVITDPSSERGVVGFVDLGGELFESHCAPGEFIGHLFGHGRTEDVARLDLLEPPAEFPKVLLVFL